MVPDEPRPDGSGPGGLAVPDDARDLARDVAALERERRAARRAARRRDRAGRLLGGSGRPVPGRLVVLALVVVAAFAALPVLLRPDFPDAPPPLPLARPAVPPGAPGGLLPEARLQTPAGDTTSRDLPRPGALVLAPVPCAGACEVAVEEVVSQLRQATRAIRIVTPGRADREGRAADALRAGPARGLATSGTDVDDVLAPAYAAAGVTVLTVAPDGVVLDVVRDVVPGRRLDQQVGRLLSSTRPQVG